MILICQLLQVWELLARLVLAHATMDDSGGLNLEQAMSLIRVERKAYIELQNQAFTGTVLLRTHLQNEEQECRGSAERIAQLDRWRAMSELHMNTKYQKDFSQKDTLIAELERKCKMLEQQVSNADVELHGLRDRYKQEETAAVHLKGAFANSETIRSELVESLSDNARLDAHREHSMRQVMGELNRTIAGFHWNQKVNSIRYSFGELRNWPVWNVVSFSKPREFHMLNRE